MTLSVGMRTQSGKSLWETLNQNDLWHTVSFRWAALPLICGNWSTDILCAVSIYIEEILTWIIYLYAPFITKAGFSYKVKCKAISSSSCWLQIPTEKGLWKYKIRSRPNPKVVCPCSSLWAILNPLLRLSTKPSQHLAPQQDVEVVSSLCAGSLHSCEFLLEGRRVALYRLKSTQPAFPVLCFLF